MDPGPRALCVREIDDAVTQARLANPCGRSGPSDSGRGVAACVPPGGEQPPPAGDSPELIQTAIDERQATSRDHIADRLGDQHIPRIGDAGETSPEMHRHPTEPAVFELAFARVHAGTDLEPDITDLVMEPAREGHRERGDLERRQESVTCRVDLPAAERLEPGAEARMVIPEQLCPGTITELDQLSGGVDDVGEQHRRQHAPREGLEVLEPPSMPVRVFHR